MFEDIISYISTLDPALIYAALFFFGFIENIFPPSPSDLVVVIGATLVAHTKIGFAPILIVTSIGSGLGFIVMYYIGKYLGETLIRSGKLKFIKEKNMAKSDLWFAKYGYNLILINRFLPGTRAVISFFCGLHNLKAPKTFLYAAVSSLVWNALLITLGFFLGENIDLIDKTLNAYSNIGFVITAIIIIVLAVRFFVKRKKNDEPD